MTATLESLGIDRLTPEDRLTLIQQIWDSLAATPEVLNPTDAQRTELERRADEDDAHPDDVVPWEQVKAEALARFAR